MSDTKKSTSGLRQFLWRQKERVCANAAKLPPSGEAEQQPEYPWYRPTLLKTAAVILFGLLLLPGSLHGQVGADIAAIMAALSKMQSLMNEYMATPLKDINQAEQTTMKYEQEVMYPLNAINQAKSSVTQFESKFTQISNMFRNVNVSSATLRRPPLSRPSAPNCATSQSRAAKTPRPRG